MASVVHPMLGRIDLSRPDTWETTFSYGGRTVELDLTIDEAGLDEEDIADLPQKLEDVERLDRAARLAMVDDAKSGDDDGAAMLYLTHHQGQLTAPELVRLFGSEQPGSADPEAMLSRLVLVRVGFYPEDEDRRVLLDYSIDPDVTDYLLCVSFDPDGEPVAVDLES